MSTARSGTRPARPECSVHLPEEYGGMGADFLYSAVVIEEIGRAGLTGIGFSLHSDIAAPYILHYGSE
ncbi:acyl-CoA dehydrogenase family protein, partial [Escherichia coli]|nr:acyl-CoA dehydrogenase family protein [Escherichia coli]